MRINKAIPSRFSSKEEPGLYRDKQGMFRIFLLILTIGAVFMFAFLFLQANNFGIPGMGKINIFFDRADKYMDFFDLVYYSKGYDFCGRPYFAYASPLYILTLHYISALFPEANNKFSAEGRVIFVFFITVSLAVFLYAFVKLFRILKVSTFNAAWFCLAFLCAYPVLFTVDRGNWSLLTSAILAVFMVKYTGGKPLSAAFLLGAAIALKYYPVIFVLIFIINKQFFEAAVCAAVAAVLILAPLSFFPGGLGGNLQLLMNGIAVYQKMPVTIIAELLGHNTSIYMLFDIPRTILNNSFNQNVSSLIQFNSGVQPAAYAVLLLCTAVSLIRKIKMHDILLLLTCGILLFPLFAGDYMITMIAMPAVYWMLKEPEDKIMPWLAGLYFICKRYISFYNHFGNVSVTVQSVLNPLILLLIIGYIILLRWEIIKSFYLNLTHGLFKKFPGIFLTNF